ncbi:cation transporter [Nitrincola schmidtii]|uniref:cation transporter n=1 Tax=Nitrincola schmidtii TaxID=1730894 RepID=UPI00197D996C|nr:cation transporter [Nitrincola schmidtii]
MATISLKLDGLTCGGCVKAVKTALEQLEGIESLEVTQESAQVSGDVTPELLIETIENAGFEAAAI